MSLRHSQVRVSETGVYNVKSGPFNAKGDGTTDDTAAIQAAITAASVTNGNTVFIPAGTYKITNELTTVTNKWTTIRGAGLWQTILSFPNTFPAQSVVDDGAINSGSTLFTSASSTFTSANVGQVIEIYGAGIDSMNAPTSSGGGLVSTIASIVGPTQVNIAVAAGETVTGARAIWGAARGGIVMAYGTAGVRDLMMLAAQPDTAVRANLIKYPPAINAPTGAAYSTIENVAIRMFIAGIRLSTSAFTTFGDYGGGDATGVRIRNVSLETFEDGIWVNNSYDTLELTNIRYWPGWEMNGNHQAIIASAPTVAIHLGRVDAWVGTNITTVGCNLGFKLDNFFHGISYVAGGSWGAMSNVLLGDGFGGLYAIESRVSISNGYDSQDAAGGLAGKIPTIKADHSWISVTNTHISAGTVPLASLDAQYAIEATNGSTVSIVGSLLQANWTTGKATLKFIRVGGASNLILSGNTIRPTPYTDSLLTPAVSIEDTSRLTMTGNVLDPTGGPANFMTIANDGRHVIQNNDFGGWTYTLPAIDHNSVGQYQTNDYHNLIARVSALFAGGHNLLYLTNGGSAEETSRVVVDQQAAGGSAGVLIKGGGTSNFANMALSLRNDAGKDIYGAGLALSPTAATAGTESADLVFATKPAGGAAVEKLRIASTGQLKVLLAGVPAHANNAAAVGAGLTAGMIYRTNGDPDALCIVH